MRDVFLSQPVQPSTADPNATTKAYEDKETDPNNDYSRDDSEYCVEDRPSFSFRSRNPIAASCPCRGVEGMYIGYLVFGDRIGD